MDCVFCKIINGEIPSNKVYEDDTTFAFLDISPQNLGHTLVITKNHHKNILEIDDNELQKLILVVKKVANAIQKGLNAEGFNVFTNTGSIAGQVIFHIHFHVVPRFAGDGIRFIITKKNYQGQEKEIIQKIRKNLIN